MVVVVVREAAVEAVVRVVVEAGVEVVVCKGKKLIQMSLKNEEGKRMSRRFLGEMKERNLCLSSPP